MAVFPKEFVWGAATAAYQIEGGAVEDGKGRSIWDVFSHTPGRTYRGETGDTACDSYHRWREDIELLKSMHLKAYRFSVAWTRIAPTGGTDWNEKGFAYYDGLVNTLLEAGIEPYITLYHWDLPQALEEKGGWQNEDTARAFAVYTAKMAEHFKGRVHQWFTFNEPACIVKMGYGTGEHAPGLKLPLEGQFTCWQNIIYAHCLAAQELAIRTPKTEWASFHRPHLLPSGGKSRCGRRPLWTLPARTRTGPLPTRCRSTLLCLGRWPDRTSVGRSFPPASVLCRNTSTTPCLSGQTDMLGLNIYNAAPRPDGNEWSLLCGAPCGIRHTAMNWPVEPESLNWGPRYIQERYGLPMFIAENGLSCTDKIYRDGKVHDVERIDFLARYLEKLSEGIQAGADVRGYFHWSLLDNYEWHSGYRERFGLVYVDYASGRRIPKDSAFWYGEVAATNGGSI